MGSSHLCVMIAVHHYIDIDVECRYSLNALLIIFAQYTLLGGGGGGEIGGSHTDLC